MLQVNKKTTSEKGKFGSNKKLGLEKIMNGLGKKFRKKSNPKNRKKTEKSKWNYRMWTKNH